MLFSFSVSSALNNSDYCLTSPNLPSLLSLFLAAPHFSRSHPTTLSNSLSQKTPPLTARPSAPPEIPSPTPQSHPAPSYLLPHKRKLLHTTAKMASVSPDRKK